MTRAKFDGEGKRALADRKDDLHETPRVATLALIATSRTLPFVVWEPCCGPGAIVRVLRDYGRTVYATDLVDYKSRDQDAAGWDFLLETQMPIGATAIVTNPPFKLQNEFVAHALDLSPKVFMLLRLAFLEGAGELHRSVLDNGKLAAVHVFIERLPMMHRAGWTGPVASSWIPFAWFEWDADHVGPAVLNRISCRPEKASNELRSSRAGSVPRLGRARRTVAPVLTDLPLLQRLTETPKRKRRK